MSSYLFPLLIVVLAIFIISRDGSKKNEDKKDNKVIVENFKERRFTAEN